MANRIIKTRWNGPTKVLKTFGRAVPRGYSYCRHFLSVRIERWGNDVLHAAICTGRIAKTAWCRLTKAFKAFGRAGSRGYPYYRHPLPVRIMHWGNVVFLAILLMSGLNIFSAHPALSWGKSSYRGVPPILEILGQKNDKGEISGVTRILGRDFHTTGFLGASRGPDGELTLREFPSWLTIPGERWLAMARRWHFFFAWLLVVNGIAFVSYAAASGHLRHELVPTRQDLRSTGRSIIDHLRFRHPSGEASKRYNVLQKSAYMGVIFFSSP